MLLHAGPVPGAQKAPSSSAGFDMKPALQELGSLYKVCVQLLQAQGTGVGCRASPFDGTD